MISPQISHHLKRTVPGGDEGSGGRECNAELEWRERRRKAVAAVRGGADSKQAVSLPLPVPMYSAVTPLPVLSFLLFFFVFGMKWR